MMIFVLDNAGGLHVSSCEAELQGAFEGIDVENGVYRFFDEAGRPLIAEFTVPNQRGKSFGVFRWVRSGTYRLLPNPAMSAPHLAESLNEAPAVVANPYFSDLQAVRSSLKAQIERKIESPQDPSLRRA